jgi:hypothetical protein
MSRSLASKTISPHKLAFSARGAIVGLPSAKVRHERAPCRAQKRRELMEGKAVEDIQSDTSILKRILKTQRASQYGHSLLKGLFNHSRTVSTEE